MQLLCSNSTASASKNVDLGVSIDISIDKLDDVVVLSVAGELDLATAELFHDAVGAALNTGLPSLVLDLSLVSFLGSAAAHVLEAALRHPGGAAVRVVATNRPTRLLLEVTGLDQRLGVYPDIASAVAG